jgi:hypothetical protein
MPGRPIESCAIAGAAHKAMKMNAIRVVDIPGQNASCRPFTRLVFSTGYACNAGAIVAILPRRDSFLTPHSQRDF